MPSASISSGRDELVAQRDGQQQRCKHGQDEDQRQRAQVHAAQADAFQRALLVLAVGRLHGQRVAEHAGRHALDDHQVALAQAQAQLGVGQQHQRADLRAALQRRGLVLQALELAGRGAAAGLAQHAGARPVRRQVAGVATAFQQDLAVAADEGDRAGAELFAQPLQRQQLRRAGVGKLVGRVAGAAAEVGHHGVQRAAAEVEAGLQRAGQAHVEPGLDAAVHELVGNRVDHQAGHHAHQRKDARQLEQQPAAEASAPHPHGQAHGRRQDDEGQHDGDADIDPVEPVVVALEEAAVRGGADDEHEGQHAGHAGQGHQRDDPAPPRELRHLNVKSGAKLRFCSMLSAKPDCRPICIGRGSWVTSSL
jgi:hypothetical protein